MISLVIEMQTQQLKKIQSKLTYLNDTATDQQLWNLATALVQLTTNTFINATKTTQNQLDPTAKRSGKPTVPITLDESEGLPTYGDAPNEITATQILLAREGNQAFYRFTTPHANIYEEEFSARIVSETGEKHYNLAIESNGHEHTIEIKPRNEIDAASNGDATLIVTFPESNAFAATTYTIFIKGE